MTPRPPPHAPLTRAAARQGRAAQGARRLLAEAVADCQADEATLWLLAADGLSLEGALNHGPTPDVLERAVVPIDGSVIGMVAASGLATGFGPGDPHHPDVDQLTGRPVVAMVAAPVQFRGRLCGVLSAVTTTPGRLFTGPDLERVAWKAYLLGLILADGQPERGGT